MRNAQGKILAMVGGVIGKPVSDVNLRLRTDLRIDGDDGWQLLDDIDRAVGYRISSPIIRQLFHAAADMVLHRVILRMLGLSPQKLHADLRLSELIQAATDGRDVEPERV